MANGFDIAASTYDDAFTHSQIGKLQRNRVYKYLTKTTLHLKNMDILEVNCGTGEDALWLSSKGHKVLATDLSVAMLTQAKHKIPDKRTVIFQQLDLKDLEITDFDKKFDLLFSNFGGLNCLSPKELDQFIRASYNHLKPKGRMILVVMPKYTLWERFYFMIKGKRKTAFRRNTNLSSEVNLAGKKIKTWYYNPSKIKKLSQDIFTLETTVPIAFFVPPSYLEPFFRNKGRFLNLFGWLDEKMSVFPWLSAYSDHYLISLQRQ